jgi:hypothetical protein
MDELQSPLVRSGYLGAQGYVATVISPDLASHVAVLTAVYRVNPDAYTPAEAEQIAREIVSMHHADRAVYGGDPFFTEGDNRRFRHGMGIG